jgi:hypothetical protein
VAKIYAPFSPEQVEQLNRYQAVGLFHEFRCYNGHPVVARRSGWFCPFCVPFSQDWAYDYMADEEILTAAIIDARAFQAVRAEMNLATE